MSAKDRAFERERAQYKKKIHELEKTLSDTIKENDRLHSAIGDLNAQILEKDDWIQRLLEYTELSEEDMKKIIEKDKKVSEAVETLSTMQSTLGRFSY